jgi:sugar phosphate isomerase/epimerase
MIRLKMGISPVVTQRLSVSTCFDYHVPITEQVALVSAAGFSHVSLGQNRSHFDYLSKDKRTELLRLLVQYSLQVDTVHGPQADTAGVDELASIAEAAVDLQAPVVVLHGGPFEFGPDELEPRLIDLRRICLQLDTISRRTGVRFALENVAPGPATELVRRAILESDPTTIGFCYDSSHDQIGGPKGFDLLLELKERLVAVHLSDRVREFVDHVIPGDGFIDWNMLCPILASARMTFPLLLEVMTTNSIEKDPSRFLGMASKEGRSLYHRIRG